MIFDTHTVWIAFALTTIAGLSTGIGSLIALLAKRTNTKFLCASLGFSAGVMLYVSFISILPDAREELSAYFGERAGNLQAMLAFFGGIGLIALIDLLIPKTNNPHEMKSVEDMEKSDKKMLRRSGVFVALALTLHNFPEGIAAFSSAMHDISVAVPIIIAIAIHNIPEGIAVSVPIYHATGSRRKAFWMSLLSGLAEPLGALTTYLFLIPFWSPALNGIIMAAVAGIMVYISLDELLPTAEKYGKHHVSISGLSAGMIFMALSMFLFI
jgi:ZIP family zinc transporter